jgi:hypothetical protein
MCKISNLTENDCCYGLCAPRAQYCTQTAVQSVKVATHLRKVALYSLALNQPISAKPVSLQTFALQKPLCVLAAGLSLSRLITCGKTLFAKLPKRGLGTSTVAGPFTAMTTTIRTQNVILAESLSPCSPELHSVHHHNTKSTTANRFLAMLCP